MAKKANLPALSEAQLEIMEAVWARGEVTVADVWKTLSARRPVARNTVLTMMTRLDEKGWLRHRVEGNAHLFSAAAARGPAQKQMVSRLVETAFGGSAEGLVMALLGGRGVRRDEAARIREMIAKAEKAGKNGKTV